MLIIILIWNYQGLERRDSFDFVLYFMKKIQYKYLSLVSSIKDFIEDWTFSQAEI